MYKKLVKKINYIAELNLPSTSAYSIHVMKMCNAIAKEGHEINLYIYSKKSNFDVFKFYNCKKFKIFSLSFFKSNNFLTRIMLALKVFIVFALKDRSNIIISRSVISVLFLSIFAKNIILEIHHELNSFTKFLFNIAKYFYFFKKIKFIFISKNLPKNFDIKKNKFIILDDAVDLDDFNLKQRKKKVFKNTCVYCGSFSKGKGVENILKISNITKNIRYHLYGDLVNSNLKLNEIKKYKNVIYKGFAKYKDIPQILSRYNVLLLPYSKKVYVRSKNIEVGRYMSPMKLFDYLASKKIIIASNLKVYSHILNSKNSVLINPNRLKTWAKKIELIFYDTSKYSHLKKNSFKTAEKYTWALRIKKILNFLNV